MKKRRFITLAIETSCDETAAAVLEDGRNALSNVVFSQIEEHKVFGGVVPEIASRLHLDRINSVIDQALSEAGADLNDVDLIGVTQGPGLVGALLVGLAAAKGIAWAAEKPIVGVQHIQGHISANYIEHKDLAPPFLALVVSGGHTSIVDVKGYNEFEILGSTRDDAAGEAFDKVARVLGLGYPGGPKIEAAAKAGDPKAVMFKRVFLEKNSLDFSFSGVKTSVINYFNAEKRSGKTVDVADVAASFQQSVMDVIVAKTMLAVKRTGYGKVAAAGGVAANGLLRGMLARACDERGIRLCFPPLALCTDNAAMIGAAAYYKYREKGPDDLTLDAFPNLVL
ncbi:MAG: tRNA (adenosine(37)-N6)-threonylcarbamoyltransferase complex transferase subunit TsaD [Clostridiales Family XIII bacterium]|jgi:N6-L-threonylcarbamoyladenine synthase|nr:tRNA (adenosine(37)-N6)-threonylcarbamoyltransferase complex transferase subunit TsaD [Clostridiales Family XIII bacterium]